MNMHVPPTKGEGDIQLNLINFGLEVLFRIISGMNYSEVDIKMYYPPKKIFIKLFFYNNMFWACKRNISLRRFFYMPKTCVIKIVIKIDHK